MFWEDWGNTVTTIWKNIEAPLNTYLQYETNKDQAKYAAEVGQAVADAERALYEAQARVASLAIVQAQEKQETQKQLTAEAWKKISPYAISIGAGLLIVTVLLLRKKQ